MIGDNESDFSHKVLLTTDKLKIFVKLLQIIYQQILGYQRLNYLK